MVRSCGKRKRRRPEIQKRTGLLPHYDTQAPAPVFRGAADFPRESGERSNPSTIFANFDGAISGKFLETSLQFGRGPRREL